MNAVLVAVLVMLVLRVNVVLSLITGALVRG
jgi:predicted histidine transporter YuiF (NhaC family)